ncbi:MAG: amidotransferase [Thermoleophilia bacterium]|nr:amidotransferase [Thermoleophilia bacterium]MCZ4495573.1 amidotransferase [Thermoleophilia bacterium]
MQMWCFQHSERVRPLDVERWATDRGVELQVVRVDLEPLPDPAVVEQLIVLGGQMNTDQVEQHPWLDAERDFLRALVARPTPRIVGICLGAQLLAEVLGGSVGRAEHPEIGWHRLELTPAGQRSPVFGTLEPSFDAFEWHGDAWTLPPGAELTVTGATCATQAFSWDGRVHGVQFHPEFTFARTTELAATTADDLTRGGAVQAAHQFLADPTRFDQLTSKLDTVLDAAFS